MPAPQDSRDLMRYARGTGQKQGRYYHRCCQTSRRRGVTRARARHARHARRVTPDTHLRTFTHDRGEPRLLALWSTHARAVRHGIEVRARSAVTSSWPRAGAGTEPGPRASLGLSARANAAGTATC